MSDSNIILRYLKVKALADRGEPGERDNAARKVAQMEAENPGLKQAAEQFIRAQNRAEERSPSPFRQDPFAGNWENIFNIAQQMYGFAQQAMNAQLGSFLARQVTPYTKWLNKTNRFVVGMKMEEEVYLQAQHMNPIQKAMFRNEMHTMLDELLDEMLTEEEDEPEVRYPYGY
jgi:hypothetical protein